MTESGMKDGKASTYSATWLVFICGILGLILLAVLSSGTSPSPQRMSDQDLKSWGMSYCQDQAKRLLKAPATAQFPHDVDAALLSRTNGIISYMSYVDSQNSFGALLRTKYICTLKRTGYRDDDWTLNGLSFMK